MNKTYKQRTLDACWELIEKYEKKAPWNMYFSCFTCPLCDIYRESCCGCILANNGIKIGCEDFESYQTAKAAYFLDDNSRAAAFQARADFFKKIIPMLELEAEENFEPKNKHYFNELDRSW